MAKIQPGQRAAFAVQPRGHRTGNPVPIDGPINVSCDDPRVAAVVNDDGLSGYFELPLDAEVTEAVAATATVTFDADLGDGMNTQTLVGALLIVSEEAGAAQSTFEIQDGADFDAGGGTG